MIEEVAYPADKSAIAIGKSGKWDRGFSPCKVVLAVLHDSGKLEMARPDDLFE
jgi:hypothetical protein